MGHQQILVKTIGQNDDIGDAIADELQDGWRMMTVVPVHDNNLGPTLRVVMQRDAVQPTTVSEAVEEADAPEGDAGSDPKPKPKRRSQSRPTTKVGSVKQLLGDPDE